MKFTDNGYTEIPGIKSLLLSGMLPDTAYAILPSVSAPQCQDMILGSSRHENIPTTHLNDNTEQWHEITQSDCVFIYGGGGHVFSQGG